MGGCVGGGEANGDVTGHTGAVDQGDDGHSSSRPQFDLTSNPPHTLSCMVGRGTKRLQFTRGRKTGIGVGGCARGVGCTTSA